MTGWNPGDMALCVSDDHPGPPHPMGWSPVKGGVYDVIAAMFVHSPEFLALGVDVLLTFKQDPVSDQIGWCDSRFIKITPSDDLHDVRRRVSEPVL